eukprot:1157221-Pelagomonas_calceolata.AAC.7
MLAADQRLGPSPGLWRAGPSVGRQWCLQWCLQWCFAVVRMCFATVIAMVPARQGRTLGGNGSCSLSYEVEAQVHGGRNLSGVDDLQEMGLLAENDKDIHVLGLCLSVRYRVQQEQKRIGLPC